VTQGRASGARHKAENRQFIKVAKSPNNTTVEKKDSRQQIMLSVYCAWMCVRASGRVCDGNGEAETCLKSLLQLKKSPVMALERKKQRRLN
jgi:hypothetical protein